MLWARRRPSEGRWLGRADYRHLGGHHPGAGAYGVAAHHDQRVVVAAARRSGEQPYSAVFCSRRVFARSATRAGASALVLAPLRVRPNRPASVHRAWEPPRSSTRASGGADSAVPVVPARLTTSTARRVPIRTSSLMYSAAVIRSTIVGHRPASRRVPAAANDRCARAVVDGDCASCDIMLPATTTLERDDIGSAQRDPFVIAIQKAVEPVRERAAITRFRRAVAPCSAARASHQRPRRDGVAASPLRQLARQHP